MELAALELRFRELKVAVEVAQGKLELIIDNQIYLGGERDEKI